MPADNPTRPIASAARRRILASLSVRRVTRSGVGGAGGGGTALRPRGTGTIGAGGSGAGSLRMRRSSSCRIHPSFRSAAIFGAGAIAGGALAHAVMASSTPVPIVTAVDLNMCVMRELMLSQSPDGFRYTSPPPLSSALDFRYIAIEGPAGVGKSLLADRLGSRLDATVVLDEAENPFLADFHADRPGAGFQAQLFFTLSRHRQQTALRQSDLFAQLTISDYLFDRDKIYAYLNLDDNELFIYQRLYELLAQDVPTPDLVIFLQTPTDILRRRLRDRERANPDMPSLDDDYVRELNEAYNHFFFHYTATPLLVVETSEFDLSWGEDALADLERQLRSMGRGTRYYVPRR